MCPTPRSSWLGKLDAFVGPGATPTEIALQFIPPLLFASYIILFSAQPTIQKLVSSILAVDLLGGVLTNATTAAKRWYHRQGRTKLHHLSFIALHLLQLSLFAGFLRDMDVFFFLSSALYLAVASVIILSVDDYIQRPVAMLFYSGAILMDIYVWKPTPNAPWFVPFFFLKLLISHLLPS